MRTLTIATLTLAASLSFAGIASADEGISRENAESAAVAAQSWQEAHEPRSAASDTALGYSTQASHRAQQIDAIFSQPAHPSNDALFLDQGDRGLGTN
ncbi:hypothetical protein [Xanthobacter variabilis]|uniref:hypothetical protein n=1 Tax=Xanthobacter variabilis TaxID=3119932 RepID=UPI0037284665